MSLPYNPFLDPNYINGPVRPGLNGTVQAAPQPQQPQPPQLPPGVGEFLTSYGKAVENMGLAGPGHGRNQTIADRAAIESKTAAIQRATFNAAFPRGRGADGLMPVPQIDPALMAQGEANRRAGGDRRRMLGDSNVPANQPQVGFQQVGKKSSDLIGLQAPPQSLGGVLTPRRPPAYTGRGGDFRDKATGTTTGLIDYNAPDGEKYKDSNVWTAQGSVTYPPAPAPAPEVPPNIGQFLQGLQEQAHLAFPQAPEVSTMPQEPEPQPPVVDEAAANQAAGDRYDAAIKPPVAKAWPHTQYSDDLWNEMKALPPGARPLPWFGWLNGVAAEGIKNVWEYLSTPPPPQR